MMDVGPAAAKDELVEMYRELLYGAV